MMTKGKKFEVIAIPFGEDTHIFPAELWWSLQISAFSSRYSFLDTNLVELRINSPIQPHIQWQRSSVYCVVVQQHFAGLASVGPPLTGRALLL